MTPGHYTPPERAPMLDAPTTDAARAAREALREMEKRPDAPVTVHVGKRELTMPDDAVDLLREALAQLADGRRVRVIVDERELTTQEAADLLNLSRPHFIRLLEAGKLPFHAVGTHRRVLLDDVLAYKAERTAKRKRAFRILADEAQKHDLDR